MEEFKNMSLIIIEKEILQNQKRFSKDRTHYEKIRNQILRELEKHFYNFFQYDTDNLVQSISKIKIDMKEYLETRKQGLRESFQKNIPSFEWDGVPKFKLEVLGVQKEENDLFNLIITCPFNIDDKLVHRNLFISTVIQFCLLNLSKQFNLHFNKLIVYFPLTIERKEFFYEDIVGVFQETEWFKIIKTIVSGCTAKAFDTTNCKFCENNFFCYHRTSSSNKYLKMKIIYGYNDRIREMI